MRLIVALALIPFAIAQTAREKNIARMESNLAAHPDDTFQRESLIKTYFGVPNSAPEPGSPEGRRRHILWFIENRPDWPALATFPFDLSKSGVKADPVGFDEAEKLWRSQMSHEPFAPAAAANAAWFFKMSDRALARSLVEKRLGTPTCAGVLGVFDVLDWLGATELNSDGWIVRFDAERRRDAAYTEIEMSENPVLLGRAGEFLLRQLSPALRLILEAPDAADIASRWLRKAHMLDPANPMWSAGFAESLMRVSSATIDPHARVQLLSEALQLAQDPQKGRVLAQLVDAEFRAGEDAALEKHAKALLEYKTPDSNFSAHTALGRLALARGDVEGARQHLFDSVRSNGSPVLGSFGPRMTLAQDLLEKGEKDAVVEYFELCRKFWKNDRGFLDHFEPIVMKGGRPDLTAPYLGNSAPVVQTLPMPEIIPGDRPRWKAVNGAESYVVEWDIEENGRWPSDRPDGAVRIIPTRDTFADLNCPAVCRWRVLAVGRSTRGKTTEWRKLQ